MSYLFNPFTGKFDVGPSPFVFIDHAVSGLIIVIQNKTLLQREPVIEDGGGYVVDDGGEVLLF
jgi:hypothetical protein